MMKRIILIVFGVSFCFHLWGQQEENYCQKLVNMVMADSCFQAIDYMEKHRDIISLSKETMALYKYKMFGFMNQPDSSIFYLKKIIEDYPSVYGGKGSSAEPFFLNALLDLYYKNGDYSKALELYTSIEKGLHPASIKENAEWINIQLKAIKGAKQSLTLLLENPKPKWLML